MKAFIGSVIVGALMTAVLAAIQLAEPIPLPAVQIVQGHDPEHCARTGDFLPDGTPIVPCQCKRMGHGDGEDCPPDHEPNDCKAWCKGEWCSCPVECSITADQPNEEPR